MYSQTLCEIDSYSCFKICANASDKVYMGVFKQDQKRFDSLT